MCFEIWMQAPVKPAPAIATNPDEMDTLPIEIDEAIFDLTLVFSTWKPFQHIHIYIYRFKQIALAEFPCRVGSRLVAWRMRLLLQWLPKRLWNQLSRTSFSVFLINVSMFKLYLLGQGRLDVEMPGVRRRNAREWRRNARGWRRNARGRRRNATCFCFRHIS